MVVPKGSDLEKDLFQRTGNVSLPMLEVDGTLLTSSLTIARFLAESGKANWLLGATPAEEASVDQWTSWIASEFTPSLSTLAYATFG